VNALAIGYAGAFGAGIASFVSPCILPLVPAYLSFLAGVSYDDAVETHARPGVRRRLIAAAVAFVVGFVLIFVAFGASATLIGRVLTDQAALLAKISGVMIIALGLLQMGVLHVGLAARDLRFHPKRLPAGPLGAFVTGLAFAFGWTPCVGPILAAILALAANDGSVGHGVILLAAYGAGIGVPFLAAAFALAPFTKLMGRWRERMRVVEVSVGSLMVATGALIFTGSIASVGGWLLQKFPALGRVG
jgi:cytochrome c-type biogenesis protein